MNLFPTKYGDDTYSDDKRTTKADGNGRRWNFTQYNTDWYMENDFRGKVYLWGGIVQQFRGYMKRCCNGYPYNTGYIGMDKDYNWDDNQRCNVLPLYPENISCDEECNTGACNNDGGDCE